MQSAAPLVALALLVAAPTDASIFGFNQALRGLGQHPDGDEAEDKLQNIMAEAQMSLSKAERHHKKIVKKTRKQAETVLTQEGKAFGMAVRHYASELQASTANLEATVIEARQALKQNEATNKVLSMDWRSPDMEGRARLSALISIVDREVKRSQRWLEQDVHSVESRAESPLEDDTVGLGRKVGDLTPIVDDAKKILDEEAEKALQEPSQKVAFLSKNLTTNLNAEVTKLKQARAHSKNVSKEAGKKLDAELTAADNDLQTKLDKMGKDLDAAQAKEIENVRNVPTLLPPKPKEAKHAKGHNQTGKHAKAAAQTTKPATGKVPIASTKKSVAVTSASKRTSK